MESRPDDSTTTTGRYPVVGVGVVVFKPVIRDLEAGECVLLIRRGKPPRAGEYSLPGGRQEWGEPLRNAARREVMEETGADVEILDLVEALDSITEDETGVVAYHYTLVDFVARWRSGMLRPGDDAVEAIWADPDDLEKYRLWTETARVIAKARAIFRERFPVDSMMD